MTDRAAPDPDPPPDDEPDDWRDDDQVEVELVVPEALAGERVDRCVALETGWSRAAVERLVDAGSVHVDGRPVPKGHRLAGGSVVTVRGAPRPAEAPTADPSVPVVVRHLDDDLIVVAKPAGLVVHPGAGNEEGTLVHGLLARFPELVGVGERDRPGIVHRLDRGTSGLLVVARTEAARRALVEALASRRVERRYLALVWGVPAAPRGVVDAPIGRAPVRRTRMAVRAGGRPARTGYEVRERFARPSTALLECRLESGRTHQIRVHLSAVGHPVVGDATYGGAREGLVLDRPFLHAWSLGFDHPRTGRRIDVTEELPADLEAVLARLREEQGGTLPAQEARSPAPGG